jgi:thymidylate kinase
MAESDPGRYLVVDATRPAGEIAARISGRVEQLLATSDGAEGTG